MVSNTPAAILGITNEAAWQRTVIEAATVLGWSVYHTRYSIGSDRGYPDLTLIHPRHGALWIELKGPRGRVSAEQQIWIERLREAGQRAMIAYPQDWPEVEAVLRGEGK